LCFLSWCIHFVEEVWSSIHGHLEDKKAAASSSATEQSGDEREKEQDDENEEQNLRDPDRASGDSGKAQQSGNQRDHKKYGGVLEHFLSFR